MNVTTKNYAIGARVVRGPSWKTYWEDQDEGSLCGIIKKPSMTQKWMIVSWIDRIGKMLRENAYPIDTPALQFYNKAPLYERGMKIKVCDEGECQGDGFLHKPTGDVEEITGVANDEGEILDIIWLNDKYYYNLSCHEKNVSYIAEDALIPLDEKPQPKFKVGDVVYMIKEHPASLVAKTHIANIAKYTTTSFSIGESIGQVKQVIYSDLQKCYYYCTGSSTSYREECLALQYESKPQSKYKVGEILYMKDRRHPQCVVSKQDLEDGKPDFNTSSLPSGDDLGKVREVIYCEQNSSYYYLSDRYFPNCYLEDAIQLANEPKSLVKEKQTTIINNQKPKQNGTEQSTTGKTIEVCDSIESIPVGKRSTGTVIQGGGSNPSVVSRPVSYKAITC
jgi:hypothetical protein